MALEMKFCSSRRSSRRSDSTGSEQGTKVSSSPLARALGANSISSERIRSAILKLDIAVVIAPASSREMSSSAPRISSIASSESSMFSTRRESSPPFCRSTRLVT
jgi:hypothetical protein